MNKEIKEPKDLIGEEWTCWKCKRKEIITRDGVSHIRKDHFERYNLYEAFHNYVYERDLEAFVWYGKPTEIKTI